MAGESSEFVAKGTETEPLCPLCNAAAGMVKFSYPDIKIIRCTGCGLWRTCPRLSAKELDAYYEQHHYSDELQQSGNYESWRAKNAGFCHDARACDDDTTAA